MKSGQIYKQLAKYFSGEASLDEIKEVTDWLNESPENYLFYEEVKTIWENTLPERKFFDTNRAWENLRSISVNSHKRHYIINIKSKKNTSRYFNYFKIAAIIIVMVGISYLYYSPTSVLNTDTVKISTKLITSEKGEIRKVRLADGTIVTLNAESILETPGNFSNNERKVSLTGEAFFEVAHNSQKPFIVIAGNSAIKVMGTKFNVTAWQESNEVLVAVADGKVSFTNNNKITKEPIFVNKNEMSVISGNNNPLKSAKVDVEKYYLAWLRNELNFYNSSFKNIMQRLEIKYGVSISVEDVSILDKHLTANFKNEQLEEILQTLSIALDLKYYKEKKSIVFYYSNK